MITKKDLELFGAYTNMRGIEANLQNVGKYLKLQKSRKAHIMAEKIDYCLYCLQVQFPDCFPEPAPAFFVMPFFEEEERKLEEATARKLAAREARRACK